MLKRSQGLVFQPQRVAGGQHVEVHVETHGLRLSTRLSTRGVDPGLLLDALAEVPHGDPHSRHHAPAAFSSPASSVTAARFPHQEPLRLPYRWRLPACAAGQAAEAAIRPRQQLKAINSPRACNLVAAGDSMSMPEPGSCLGDRSSSSCATST